MNFLKNLDPHFLYKTEVPFLWDSPYRFFSGIKIPKKSNGIKKPRDFRGIPNNEKTSKNDEKFPYLKIQKGPKLKNLAIGKEGVK